MISNSIFELRETIFYPMKLVNILLLKWNQIKCLKVKINGLLLISNKGQISIGAGTKINSSKYKNVIGGDSRTSFVVKQGAKLIIGQNVKISNSAIYCANNIYIGDNVMIGGSCKIWDTDFHPLDPIMRASNPNEGYVTRPIIIHENAFIGGFSIILKGSAIGRNSVVGAGSVVSGKIPDNEIWAGNPARFVKKLEPDD